MDVRNRNKVSDIEIKFIGFAISNLIKQYPNNNGKIYLSLVQSFFKDTRNQDKINDSFKDVDVPDKDRLLIICEYMSSIKLLNLRKGGNGAKYLFFNQEAFDIYLKSLDKKDISDLDIKNVCFAIVTLLKQYPNNNGKIYLSLVQSFFKDQRNQEIIKQELSNNPNYSLFEIIEIANKLNSLRIIKLKSGGNGAKFFFFNPETYEQYLLAHQERKLDEIDSRIILFVVKTLQSENPKYKNAAPISAISSYFNDANNENKLFKRFDNKRSYSEDELLTVIKKLVRNNILSLIELSSTQRYVFVNKDDEHDFKAVIFAIETLQKEISKYANAVPLNAVYQFFKDPINDPKFISKFNKKFNYSDISISTMVKELTRLDVLSLIELPSKQQFVFINKKQLNDLYNEEDEYNFKAMIFAIESLNDIYPNNHGNVYLSNINTFFKDKRNNPKLIKEFNKTFSYSKDAIADMIDILNEHKIVEKRIGPKGGIIVRLLIKTRFNKENTIIQILALMNGRCGLETLKSIVFNKDNRMLSPYITNRVKNIKEFKNEKDFENTISYLKDHNFIMINSYFVSLTYQGDIKN